MKTIEENNRMVAEFMGYDLSVLYDLDFDTSWDWLMRVVDRIKNLEVDTRDKEIVLKLTLSHGLADVYYCVCKFIDWYNEQKK